MPKVSFVLPSVREGHEFNRCLRSLLNQTLDDIEIIILNNNPNRKEFYKEPRIKWVDDFRKEYPVAQLFNHGVSLASSDIICLQNDDDMAEKFKAELFWYFLKDSEFDAIITDFYTNDFSKVIPCRAIGYDYETMLLGNYIAFQTIGWKKSSLAKINTVAKYKQVWDYATLLYAGQAGLNFRKLDIPTETIFLHNGNMHRSIKGLEDKIAEYYRLREEMGIPHLAKMKIKHWEGKLAKAKSLNAQSRLGEQVERLHKARA
jgi:glycosyltransferase involved in cell wall biosynthesis